MSRIRTFFLRSAALAALLAVPALGAPACNSGEDVPIGDDAQPVKCASDAECSNGKTCQSGHCKKCDPVPEACNGIDDDCNGAVDDAVVCPGGGMCQSGVCMGVPVFEVCDGVDNDKDGQIDEGAVCPKGGVCVNGQCSSPNQCQADSDCPPSTVCENGQCVDEGCIPKAEVCNAIDDDCNGAVDDGATCVDGGTCMLGNCTAPWCKTDADCAPGGVCINGLCGKPDPNCVPKAEVCNGLDDDCDGVVDDGNPGGGQLCATGKIGECKKGLTTCTKGVVVCADTVAPAPEKCNGLDEDCDGQLDNGAVCFGNAACVNGNCLSPVCKTDAECAPGFACQNNACVGPPAPGCTTDLDCGPGGVCVNGLCGKPNPGCVPVTEKCNGLDDDCDGVVDNNLGPNSGVGQSCNNGKPGVCGAGALSCDGGALVCVTSGVPSLEVCNGLDDDCDGTTDESVTCGNALEMCFQGKCTVVQCGSSMDCPKNTTCQSGVCKP